jgi:hypothetical protein
MQWQCLESPKYRNRQASGNRPVQLMDSPARRLERRHSAMSIVRSFLKPSPISISGMFFDGQSLRIEFAVSRVDEVKPNIPITGRRYPACRLVLPPGAAVELINRMQQIGAALTKAGVVKQSEAPKT